MRVTWIFNHSGLSLGSCLVQSSEVWSFLQYFTLILLSGSWSVHCFLSSRFAIIFCKSEIMLYFDMSVHAHYLKTNLNVFLGTSPSHLQQLQVQMKWDINKENYFHSTYRVNHFPMLLYEAVPYCVILNAIRDRYWVSIVIAISNTHNDICLCLHLHLNGSWSTVTQNGGQRHSVPEKLWSDILLLQGKGICICVI